MNSNETVISAQGLTKVFKDFWGRPKARAVDGIDFEVRRGETLVLMGPSGTGKSVTLRHAIGILKPDEGRVVVRADSQASASGLVRQIEIELVCFRLKRSVR